MKQKQRMFGILAALVLLLALGVVLATRYTAQKTAAEAIFGRKRRKPARSPTWTPHKTKVQYAEVV